MHDVLYIPEAVVAAILAHAASDAPREACGLLVGGGSVVTRAVATPNADASATRYSIPPDRHFAAIRDARTAGLDVVGAYHSHPHGRSEPSPTDTAEAFADFVFVIAGLEPRPHVRAWQLLDGNFVELRLVRT